MKRLFSYILSAVLLVTSLSVGFTAVAEASSSQNELKAFATNLADMICRYDSEDADSSSDSTPLDKITEHFPITYPEQFLSVYENVKNDGFILEADKNAEDFGLPENSFDSNRLIVKSTEEIDYYGAVDCVSGYKDLYILQYASIEATISAYEYYLSLDVIEYVEPDYVASVQAETSSSSLLDSDSSDYYEIIDKVESWNSGAIGFDEIKNELVQKKLNDVTVAVVDSGVDLDHELLAGRIIDSNVNLSGTGTANSCEDDYGHGTHVAGIIVDNSLSNVKVKPYKVLNNRGKGTVSVIAVAVDMAVEDGVDIINLSLTSKGESKTMTESVDAATAKNINVVVAAGNKSDDLSKTYYTPACIESAITVSAVTKDYKLASYSNYNGPIDISAPGNDIKSSYLNNTYTLLDGTSMASPQVAAGLAIVKSVYSDLSSKAVEEKIKEFSIKMAENAGENFFGSGILYLKYILSVMPRTAEPVFDIDDCEFSSTFKLTITCPEADATILYIIHNGETIEDIGFFNGSVYKEAISISVDTKISAVAYSKGKLFSSIVTHEYIRGNSSEEDKYDIDKNGLITGYYGNETDLIVPEKIRGTIVKGIGEYAFENNSDISSVSLPSTANVIGKCAFMGCTSIEAISGEGITKVENYAFNLCTLSDFPFNQLTYIGSYAFSGCNNLENVDLCNAEFIGKSAFENSQNVFRLKNENNVSIGEAAFRGTNIISVELPNVTSINGSVFENCSKLISVDAVKAETVKQKGFSECISLTAINLPKVETLDKYAFKNTALTFFYSESIENVGNYAFSGCTSMKWCVLINTTTIGSYVFSECTNIKMVHLPQVTQLNNSIFAKCENLKSVWFPSVEIVNSWAFKDSYIEYIQLDKIKTINSLPDSLIGIVLPTSFLSSTCSVPKTDFIVYGYEGTYAEEYANAKGKSFVTVPVMICETPENVSIDEQYIFTYALGFNCTYQWYKNDTVSNENGIAIDGATHYWYEPTKSDNAVCYYCVITSDDGVNHSEIVSEPITNIPEYQVADFTEYNSVVEEAAQIDRELYTDESLSVLDELLSIDISEYSLAEQELIFQHIENIKDAISNLLFDYELGDINDDGKISLLDARLTLKAVSGTEELNRLQSLSADVNEDGKISLIDVRAILRIISEMTETE